MQFQKTLFYLREYLFPFGCSLCGVNLSGALESFYGLCSQCRESLDKEFQEIMESSGCDYCGKPLISEIDRCLSCRNNEQMAFDRAFVLFPYTGKYQRLLAAYKFSKNLALGNFFAEKIAQALSRFDLPEDIAIVPVPPRQGKIRASGWDQIEYLAHLLDKDKGGSELPPLHRCLKRLESKSQKELGRDNRKTNLRKRIVPVKQVPQTAILIDDVMTTGSTLDACALALKEGGAKTVYGLCLFYD